MYRRTADIGTYRAIRSIPSVNVMRNHPTTEPATTHHNARAGTLPDAGQASRPGRRVVVVVGAAVGALLLWLAAGPGLGIDLAVLPTPDATTSVPVTAGSVIVSSVVAGLLGWALLAVLERSTHHGATIWRWVAGAVAVLSLSGPLTLAQSTGGGVVLALLHVVVAGTLLLALPGASATRAVTT